MGGGSPQNRPFLLHLPLPRPLGLVLKDSSPPPLPSMGQGAADGATMIRGRAALLLPSPSFFQGRVQTRQDGAPQGFAPEGGFWARVCKAIFLCGGKGKQGMNTGYGERVRNGGEGRRKGPPCWSTVTGVLQTKKHACAQDPQWACSQPLQPGSTPPLRAPSQTPEKVVGYSCRTVHSGPTLRCPQPLLPF